MKCPCCGSTNINLESTEGNGVGNTMGCLDCFTDFTPTPKEYDAMVEEVNKFLGRKQKRKVLGKPHKTREKAERAAKFGKRMHAWHDVDIEERNGYFVVTGYDIPRPRVDRSGISNPIQGRYRWPGK